MEFIRRMSMCLLRPVIVRPIATSTRLEVTHLLHVMLVTRTITLRRRLAGAI